LTKSGSGLIPVAPRTPATVGETQIKLDESCETVISRNVLKNAISYGKSGPSTVYFFYYGLFLLFLSVKYCFFLQVFK